MLGTKFYATVAALLSVATITSAGLNEAVKTGAEYFQDEYDKSYAQVQEYVPEAKNAFNSMKGELNTAIATVRDIGGLDMTEFFSTLIGIGDAFIDFSENGINSANVNFEEYLNN
jgi:hypothetical protein